MNTTGSKENRNEAAIENTAGSVPAPSPIIATRVPDRGRLSFMPRYLGKHRLIGEALVYATLESMCEEYRGGYWDFYDLSNGGFYMAPAMDRKLRLIWRGNFFDGEVSANAAGIIATLMALNQLSWETSAERYSDLFYLLREFALEHVESELILRAID